YAAEDRGGAPHAGRHRAGATPELCRRQCAVAGRIHHPGSLAAIADARCGPGAGAMTRFRELALLLEARRTVFSSELMGLQPLTRVIALALIGWSGLAAAATTGALVAIETAAQGGLVRTATGANRTASLEQRNGEAILQRPVFSRTRQAAPTVMAIPQAPSPPPTPALAPVLRDSG